MFGCVKPQRRRTVPLIIIYQITFCSTHVYQLIIESGTCNFIGTGIELCKRPGLKLLRPANIARQKNDIDNQESSHVRNIEQIYRTGL